MKCVICGKEFEGFGNNPWPIATGADEVCCDECNWKKVVPERLKLSVEFAEEYGRLIDEK